MNPGGQDTHYYFEYGTSTKYGATTASTDAGSGRANVSVSAALSGLSPNTTYHYQLVATYALGTAVGGDETFTTSAVVTTGGATSLTTTSATLTGSVNPQGKSTTYHFDYGPTTAYGSRTPDASAGSGTAAVNASASVGGLSPNTTYHYRLHATNGVGADKTFTTPAPPQPPAVLTASATSITTTSANLTGSVNPQGQSTSYYFQYGTTSSYGSQSPLGDAGAGTAKITASAAVGGLSPATTYHYRLVATNATGPSFGADKTFTTAKAPVTPPPVAKTGAAQNITLGSATLTGTANPKGSATTYYFQYGQTAAYGAVTPTGNAGSGSADVGVSATLGGLALNTTYHYRLVVTSAGGTSFGADTTFVTFPALGVLLNASRADAGRRSGHDAQRIVARARGGEHDGHAPAGDECARSVHEPPDDHERGRRLVHVQRLEALEDDLVPRGRRRRHRRGSDRRRLPRHAARRYGSRAWAAACAPLRRGGAVLQRGARAAPEARPGPALADDQPATIASRLREPVRVQRDPERG